MKTTVDLPEDLLVSAKKKAAEGRTTLREIIARGLRRELSSRETRADASSRRIRWVVVDGGLPPGLDLADRARMHDWIRAGR